MTAEQYVKAKHGQLRQLAWLMAAAKLSELPKKEGVK